MRKMIVANWKMNCRVDEANSLFVRCQSLAENVQSELVICPPATYLMRGKSLLGNSKAKLGAQNTSQFTHGAYTGEVSPLMLADCGCSYVILGHSERREKFLESDQVIASKFKAVLDNALNPIVCIGETASQRENNETYQVIKSQLDAILVYADHQHFTQTVIAYEPIWAIGSNHSATNEQIRTVMLFIKDYLNKFIQPNQDLRVIYGGSVSDDNAEDILGLAEVDGCLVGGASLNFAKFERICFAADAVLSVCEH